MQLSRFTDYAFRALLYLAYNRDRLCTVEELSVELKTSEHHIKKVIHKLAKTPYVEALKGRSGGVRLGVEPNEINLGDVLRLTEDNMNLFECFRAQSDCPFIHRGCKLKRVTSAALNQFIKEYEKYTLQDVM